MKKKMINLSIILIIIIITIVFFFIFTNHKKSQNKPEELEKLSANSKEIIPLINTLKNIDDIRKPSLYTNKLSNEEIIKQILITLEPKDYKIKTIKPVKVTCSAAKGIYFISEKECKIKVIDNDKFMEYQKKLFNTNKEIDFININYQGMNCKNNGKNYYCQLLDYSKNNKSFSLIDKVLKNKDKIYIYEYYANINLNNPKSCLKYYSKDVCNNKINDLPEPSKDKIKKNGVYYKHTFELNDMNQYYLYSSEISK